MSRKSVDNLHGFIEEWYVNNPGMGSPDISAGIRDLLTDLLHLGDRVDVSIQSRLLDAEEVYNQEIEE